MLADDDVTDAALAQLAVHVLDEDLGQPHRRLDQRVLAFHAQQHQRQHQRDRIEAPGHGVGHAAIGIPLLLAGDLDDAMPQRANLRAVVAALAEQG